MSETLFNPFFSFLPPRRRLHGAGVGNCLFRDRLSAPNRWENMSNLENLGFTDSGAGTAKSLSVPQLSPIFSYPTEGGNVYIYVVKAGFAVFVFATFDDTHAEYAYAIETLVSKPALVTKPDISPTKVVYDMLEQAEREFYDPFISNPFKLLKEDHEARTRLIVMLRKFLDASGE